MLSVAQHFESVREVPGIGCVDDLISQRLRRWALLDFLINLWRDDCETNLNWDLLEMERRHCRSFHLRV